MRREALLWAAVFSIPTGIAAGSGVYFLANAPVMGALFGAGMAVVIFVMVLYGASSTADEEAAEQEPGLR